LRRVEALSRRGEALEHRDAVKTKEGSSPAHAAAVPKEATLPASTEETANDASSAPSPQESAGMPPPPDPAPGQFTIDEEAVQRALERALVQTGALLLDPGSAEIQPRFSYVHGQGAGPVFFGEDAVANLESRRDRLQAGLTLRFGLPFSSQVEFDLPYAYENQSDVITGEFEDSRHASGLGDFSMTLSKVLLHERGWQPDLTADIQWDSNTGTSKNGIDLGSAFNELTASLWAVKRVDPLAFVGSASYTTTFERNNISPGDSFGVSLGAVLATSPDTSLRFTLNQSFTRRVEIGDRKVPGSDGVDSTLSIGGSIVLAPTILLDVQADIGLTPGASDYAFLVSLPISFNLLN